jgi:hypothetical protein
LIERSSRSADPARRLSDSSNTRTHERRLTAPFVLVGGRSIEQSQRGAGLTRDSFDMSAAGSTRHASCPVSG